MSQPTQLDASILNTMLFRLLFGTQDDRYEFDSACHLLRGLRQLDDESAAVTVKLWVVEAEGKMTESRN